MSGRIDRMAERVAADAGDGGGLVSAAARDPILVFGATGDARRREVAPFSLGGASDRLKKAAACSSGGAGIQVRR